VERKCALIDLNAAYLRLIFYDELLSGIKKIVTEGNVWSSKNVNFFNIDEGVFS
jgi:hypothetical protein